MRLVPVVRRSAASAIVSAGATRLIAARREHQAPFEFRRGA